MVTESWSSRYKSSITDSKIKRTIRRVQNVVEDPAAAHTAASKLLASEGFGDDDLIDPRSLPAKMTDAVKGFHEHARYFMVRFGLLLLIVLTIPVADSHTSFNSMDEQEIRRKIFVS